ncbi:unnamed protein product [Spodoptera exigua]|nr:unnamed protein product [Spodoptera exigua]
MMNRPIMIISTEFASLLKPIHIAPRTPIIELTTIAFLRPYFSSIQLAKGHPIIPPTAKILTMTLNMVLGLASYCVLIKFSMKGRGALMTPVLKPNCSMPSTAAPTAYRSTPVTPPAIFCEGSDDPILGHVNSCRTIEQLCPRNNEFINELR